MSAVERRQAPPWEAERYQRSTEPADYIGAVAMSRAAGQSQQLAETFLRDKAREYAEAVRVFRQELAKRITQKKAEGKTATMAKDLARGDHDIAELEWRMNMSEGVYEAAKQAIWRHTADRRDCEHFIEWSMRAAFLDLENRHAPDGDIVGRRQRDR